MEVRYYRDPETGLPHIYEHGWPKQKPNGSLPTPARMKFAPAVRGRHWVRRRADDTCAWSTRRTR